MLKRLFAAALMMGALQNELDVLGNDEGLGDPDASTEWQDSSPEVDQDFDSANGPTVMPGPAARRRSDAAQVGSAVATTYAPHVAVVRLHLLQTDPRAMEQLLGTALDRCRQQGMLKVIVTTRVPEQEVCCLAQRHGFLFSHQREDAQGNALHFYANLYYQPDTQKKPPAYRPASAASSCSTSRR